MSEPIILWQKDRWRLIDLGCDFFPSHQFQYENDGEWFSVSDKSLVSYFAEHYKKLKAVADAARLITHDMKGNWNMHTIANLEKALEALDE